jgi:hypothetical protein
MDEGGDAGDVVETNAGGEEQFGGDHDTLSEPGLDVTIF